MFPYPRRSGFSTAPVLQRSPDSCKRSWLQSLLAKLLNLVTPNQIKSLLLSHHHSTSALVSEILMSVLQTVQKNNRQFTYGQTVQKKKKNRQFTYGQTVQKTALEHLQCSRQCKKNNNNSNLHMDRQCKKATAIYIWTVHIYRLYRRQCAKYTYIYSVHIVYYVLSICMCILHIVFCTVCKYVLSICKLLLLFCTVLHSPLVTFWLFLCPLQ